MEVIVSSIQFINIFNFCSFAVCDSGDMYDVMRGYWFVDTGWQPLDDEYADVIEKEHIALFEDELLCRNNDSLPKCRTKSIAG